MLCKLLRHRVTVCSVFQQGLLVAVSASNLAAPWSDQVSLAAPRFDQVSLAAPRLDQVSLAAPRF